MSAGPSALGTLLVQRLDAVLGTTLSAQANLVSGARPDAVAQAGHPERPDPARSETRRHPREAVDRLAAQTEQQGRHAIDRARLDARTAAALLARSAPDTAATHSAPTTLGRAAKIILALLAAYPEESPVVQGRRPLLERGPGADTPPEAPRPRPAGRASEAAAAGAGARTAGNTGPGPAASAPGVPSGGTGATGAASPGAGTVAAGGAAAAAAPETTGVATPMAPRLAQALAQALQGSGLFYESHLNKLAFGKHGVAELRQEPQALIARPAASAPSDAATPPRAPADGPAHSGPAAARGAEQPGAAQQPAPSSPIQGLEPQTQALVRQQLEVLANQVFAWRGEAWPDAPMDWEVVRRQTTPEDPDAAQTEHWATRITLHLPVLGTVQARLSLSGRRLAMHLAAPDSADLLGRHADALRGRYSAQGLQLGQLSIASSAAEPREAPVHAEDAGPGSPPEPRP